LTPQPRTLISPSKLSVRIAAMGRQISKDYSGKTVDAIVMLENGFVFGADLLRKLTCPVVCHFVRSESHDIEMSGHARREIFFSKPPVLKDRNVLLVDAVLRTGVTLDFLAKRLMESSPHSLRIAVLIDRPEERHVELRADYFGFKGASNQLVGYGLAGRQGLFRNLGYIGTLGGSGLGTPARRVKSLRKPQRIQAR
jgi:hypoxanthine phosphoribosyltransferase